MPVASERASLVRALSAVALSDRRLVARRFLQGLSTEELRYIASYLGACLLESAAPSMPASRNEMAWEILQYECCQADGRCNCPSHALEHKMILLLEYLSSCRCSAAMKIAAGSA